jgi:hypothetical protein
MDNERSTLGGLDLMRWMAVAILILAGIGLFFLYGKRTESVVAPSVVENDS